MNDTLPAPTPADEPAPKLTLEEAAAAVRDARKRFADAITTRTAASIAAEAAFNEAEAARDALVQAERDLLKVASA